MTSKIPNGLYTYLTQQLKIPADQIIVYGRSVGGGSATALATQQPICRVNSRKCLYIRLSRCGTVSAAAL